MEMPLVPRRFLDRAESVRGDGVGVVCGPRRFTYAEFGQRCNRLSHAIADLGAPRGATVAYLGLNCHRLLEAYYGVVQAGYVLLPLNVRLSVQELAFILDDAEVEVLLVGQLLAPLAAGLLKASGRPLRVVLCADGPDESGTGWADYEALLAAASPERPSGSPADGDVAEIFYTSGTTGRPKGVMLTHRNLFMHGVTCLSAQGVSQETVWLHTLPLFHVNGWGSPHFVTAVGGRHVVMPRFDAAAALALIQAEGVTHMNLVPAMGAALLMQPALASSPPATMQRIMLGGAPVPPPLIGRLEAAFGCRVQAGYGLTETCPVLTLSEVRSEDAARLGQEERLAILARAGTPLVGVDVRVVDDQMRDVPRDGRTTGEVVARGDMVMKGYWKHPEETAEAFAGGWFHTGDVATWDAGGAIDIVDRKKDIIISGGENVASVEIELCLAAHPAVLEAAVVAQPDERWGEVPHAFVALKPGTSATADELREHVRSRLAGFKVPAVIDFLPELPKTGTGKVLKTQLREPLWKGRGRRVG
jgi:fatty-acyl-CoA synthase